MYSPHRRILYWVVVLLATFAASAVPQRTNAQNTSPQRLRVRVENNRLKPGEQTKVVVEFLDMNYNQVANDAKREILIGQSTAGSRQTGAGQFKPDKIWINPGDWSAQTTFVSNQSGRLFITAESKGLDPARTLVLITQRSASFLSRLFETVVYADSAEPFLLSPKRCTAKANNTVPATFQVSFLDTPAAGTILKISTNLTDGRILYQGKKIGSSAAEIKFDGKTSTTEDIQITSATAGEIRVVAAVDGRFSESAVIDFQPPRPAKLLFDDLPKTVASDAGELGITAKLYDESTALVKADQDRAISFRALRDSDRISFAPETVNIPAGQDFAETRLKLKDLPSGNQINILATAERIQSAEKTIGIESSIHKLLVIGPREINLGREVEFTIQLAKKDDSHCVADWERTIDLSIDGGNLSRKQITIGKGQRQASVKFTAPAEMGTYTLTALSSEIEKGTAVIKVVNPSYWLVVLALLGSLIGGIARQLHKDALFARIRPRWNGRRWDSGLLGRMFGSVVGGLFFYWALKLGLSSALSAPVIPPTLDMGTKTVAFFLGGVGGFAGTVVLDRLARWFLPLQKRKRTQKASTDSRDSLRAAAKSGGTL